jgi:hypothetical protein
MKTLFKLSFLVLFVLATGAGLGHTNNKSEKVKDSSVKAKNISMKDFPTDMGINHINDWGGMTVGLNEMPAGTDFAPLLEGLKDNSCQVPHWGLVLEGKARIDYVDGTEVILKKDDIYFMPPGHNLIVLDDLKVLEFSPQEEFSELLQHIQNKMTEAQN